MERHRNAWIISGSLLEESTETSDTQRGPSHVMNHASPGFLWTSYGHPFSCMDLLFVYGFLFVYGLLFRVWTSFSDIGILFVYGLSSEHGLPFCAWTSSPCMDLSFLMSCAKFDSRSPLERFCRLPAVARASGSSLEILRISLPDGRWEATCSPSKPRTGSAVSMVLEPFGRRLSRLPRATRCG